MGKKTAPSSKRKRQVIFTDREESRGYLYVDVARVRFQHSRIRPVFSGCCRSVVGTLESIRHGELSPHDLPPIQVLVGPPSEEGSGHCNAGPCYFSLNNRRLWVLKRCREEGLLLPSNLVLVRVRQPKSAAEAARYTTANCALEATLMREPTSTPSSSAAYSSPTFSGPTAARRRTLTNQLTMVSRSADSDSGCNSNSELGMKETAVVDEGTREQSSDEASSHAESDCDSIAVSNRFAEFSLE